MYCFFALATFIPLFSKASLHCSSSNSSTSSHLRVAPQHPRTSSAKVFFVMFYVSESIMMANRKGLKADPWWRSTSTAKGLIVPAHISLQFRIDGTCPSPVWCTSQAPPCFACTNAVLPLRLCRMRFPYQ